MCSLWAGEVNSGRKSGIRRPIYYARLHQRLNHNSVEYLNMEDFVKIEDVEIEPVENT
jgi:hypothetical protein